MVEVGVVQLNVTKPLPGSSTNSRTSLRAGAALSATAFGVIRRAMVLHHCKWDPQVGDASTLEPFPLLLRSVEWHQLATWAEQLSSELMSAEAELLHRPDLHKLLGVPRVLRKELRQLRSVPATPRILRYDFHPTEDGWRISEVNSDVPGGFTEAGSFTKLFAEQTPSAHPTGDPATAWVDAINGATPTGGTIALLSAPGFMEDQQITAYLAQRLRAHGRKTCLVGPSQLVGAADGVLAQSAWYRGKIDAIVRFYQAEWLAQLRKPARVMSWLFGKTPVLNSPTAILTESKRFPLVWPQLRTPMTTWQKLLPETRPLHAARWRRDDEWVLKSAYCNTGDTVGIREHRSVAQWRSLCRSAFWRPSDWVAQRRFCAVSISTPVGERYPCLGVYTVNGRVAGIYGRLAERPLIDYRATDVAVLVAS